MSGSLTRDNGTGLPCFFHELAEESVVHILSFLDIIDLTNCTVVCKRWADIVGDSRLRKTVIFDLTKWETYHPMALLPRPSRSDADAFREAKTVETEWRRQLLQRFWTPKTRNVIFRRQPGTTDPPECWMKMGFAEREEGQAAQQLAAGWHYMWGDIYLALLDISKLLPDAPEGGGQQHRDCVVTVQDVHMLTGDLANLLPGYVKSVHLENVRVRCYFYTGLFHPLDKPPQVTLTVRVDKAVVVRENGVWPWFKEPLDVDEFLESLLQIRHQDLTFFGRFLPDSFTAEEESFLEEQLRSEEPTGWTLSRFLTKGVQLLGDEDVLHSAPINSLGLTLERVRSFPRWLQYLMVELLKDPSIAIFP
ncbi:uncharacterized protein LOC129600737 [Paramacrobiotus metropolitanus]|uniref:uncharacterized protein LOC129600737 n=1 Tax=Paramacrobiotus metropolitanus TaxID=2943436 RepID=UPI002445E940|nr:uncharacterized protein LOC129600737 [Paramacrobiotus metropolitanus]